MTCRQKKKNPLPKKLRNGCVFKEILKRQIHLRHFCLLQVAYMTTAIILKYNLMLFNYN